MTTFFKRLALFLLLQLPVLAVVLHQGRLDLSDHYFRAMHDKLARFDEVQASPRLILLGGSSVAFGVHSPRLQEGLGLEPVNLGLTGGLLRYPWLLRETERRVRPGDVVVLIYEHPIFVRDAVAPSRVVEFVQQVPEVKPHFLPRYEPMLRGVPGPDPTPREFLDRDALSLLANRVRRARLRVRHGGNAPGSFSAPGFERYRRSSFNAFGDFTAHHGQEPAEPIPAAETLNERPDIVAKQVAELNGFVARCAAKGVAVCFVWPPMSEAHYAANRAPLALLAKQLAGLQAPHLSAQEDTVYPLGDFYDTHFHLREESGARYTDAMIERLRPWIESRRAADGGGR